jgi:flagellar biosynthesis protein FlhG
MHDQAHRLRQIMSARQGTEREKRNDSRVIAITSGKGGVGKSNCTLNLALALCQAGKKVVILDADVGFANIDVLLGITPGQSMVNLFDCRTKIWEVMQDGPEGLKFIAGGSGFQDLLTLDERQLHYVVNQLQELQGYADFILIDTGAGLNAQTLRFILSADEAIVVTTPEPTAITDAYALIKLVSNRTRELPIRLIVNRAATKTEGEQTAEKIRLVAERFLQRNVDALGFIMDDPTVAKAVRNQVPLLTRYPQAQASRCIQQVAAQLLEMPQTRAGMKGVRSFLQRMVAFLRS